jgi:hypothetical protein
MAYFAEIDATNTVLRVLVVSDDDASRGQEFLADDLGLGGTWIQSTKGTRGGVHHGSDGEPDGGLALRYNSACKGHTYDPAADAFYPPQPYPSWTLDENYVWQPPTPKPDDGNPYAWDEDTTSWVEVEVEVES